MSGRNTVLSDLELAKKELLRSQDMAVIAVKDGQILATASGTGVQPLVNLLFEHASEVAGCAIADKVVGLAPAWLLLAFRVAAVFALVGKQQAQRLLQNNNIVVQFETHVTNILSKDRSRICPLELAIAAATSAEEALAILRHHPFVRLP